MSRPPQFFFLTGGGRPSQEFRVCFSKIYQNTHEVRVLTKSSGRKPRRKNILGLVKYSFKIMARLSSYTSKIRSDAATHT